MNAPTDSGLASPNHLTHLTPNISVLAAGAILAGRFRVIAPIGKGGQASVYKVFDEVLGNEIALKLVAPRNALDFQQVQRMRQEVLLARELSHNNIVRVFEFYQDGEWVFFTMGLIQGRSLREHLHQGITKQQAKRWSQQLLAALAACHNINIVHADIKPENIIIDERDNLVLMDFGIGQFATSPITTTQVDAQPDYSGTHGYIAPEVTQLGKRSSHSDCYSAGRLLLDLIQATRLRLWRPHDYVWRWRFSRVANGLSKPLQHQRLSILQAQQQLTNQRSLVLPLGLTMLVAIIAVVFWRQSPQVSDTPLAPQPFHTSRIALVYAPDDDLLTGVAELIQLHLITQPGLDVIEQHRVNSLMRNLGLRPFAQQEHRSRLAHLVNAEVLVLLQTSSLGSDHELNLQIMLSEMPANRLFGSFQGGVVASLPTTMAQLLAHIDHQLALPARQLIVDTEELQRVEPILQALRQGRTSEAEAFILSLQAEWPEFAGGWLAGARLAANRGDVPQAREQLQRLFELSQDDEYWYLEGRALQAELGNDLPDAIAITERLMDLFPGRAALLDRRAELATWADDAETAMRLYQQALEIDPSSPDRWFELARIRIIQGQIQPALDNELMQALVRYRQQEDLRGQGTVLNAFGVAYLRLSDAQTAAQYFMEALQLRTPERDANGRAVTLANLANARALQLRYSEAEAALAEASLLFEENNDRLGLAQVENEWGVLLEEQGRYREALTHYRNALDLRLASGYSRQQAESINNVAYMHFLMADFSQADIFWKQAKNLFARIGDESGLSRTELNLANLALSRGEYSQATTMLTEILAATQGRRPEEEMYAQFLLSHLNYSLGLWQTARENNNQALRVARNINNYRGIVEVHIWGAEMCLYLADAPCVKNHLTDLMELSEQFNQEQESLVSWLALAYELLQGNSNTSDITTFWSTFRKQLLPVQSELRVLLSVLELNPAPRDSWQWQRVRELSRPAMYKEYLQAAYLQVAQFNDEEARNQLRRSLQNHPEHWRNHLYYEIFNDPDSQRRAEQLKQRLYQYLNADQIEVYQRIYERPETSVRRGTVSRAAQPERAAGTVTH